MQKEVTKTSTATVILCDLCEKNCSNGWSDHCWLCRREVCYQCRKLLFTANANDLVEFAIHVCTKCQEHVQLIVDIQAVLDGANKDLRVLVSEWKAAAGALKKG